MKILFSIIFCFCAGLANAQSFPALYNVTDVRSDDTLNVRQMPDATSNVIDELAPFEINIEVLQLSDNRRWGKIGAGERNGWVSMRYLAPALDQDPEQIPRPMTCFGTEPFWSLTLGQRGNEYRTPELTKLGIEVDFESAARPGDYFASLGTNLTSYSLIIKRGLCSDGMSDRAYGFRNMMFRETVNGGAVYSGCCTMDGR
ncbi:MAG: hypothetical protein P8P66_12130 [Paracoccaceae bacterium]|jgi:uncharacterized membrane protein|nr:hypothetical protein [Paracoccaceae bacterium]MDG2451427.1 hypothetical protein [Paracoccaceae bacterium]